MTQAAQQVATPSADGADNASHVNDAVTGHLAAGLEKALNYPLFQALLNRRPRRISRLLEHPGDARRAVAWGRAPVAGGAQS